LKFAKGECPVLEAPTQSAVETYKTIQLLGAGTFGAVVGWYVYHINRWRKDEVHLSDIVTLLGAVGGAAVLALFPAKSDLFGAYGIGLAIGFFLYFIVLLVLVKVTPGFTSAWFLDGRAPQLEAGQIATGTRPMEDQNKKP
jgi:hypothetical protein